VAQGRNTSLTIRLTPAERRTLLTWQRATAIRAGLVRHAWILVLLADGMTITAITETVGLSRRHIYKWVQRFVQEDLEEQPNRLGVGSVGSGRETAPAGAWERLGRAARRRA
jgi:Homeodomain-like domain-containing protein